MEIPGSSCDGQNFSVLLQPLDLILAPLDRFKQLGELVIEKTLATLYER